MVRCRNYDSVRLFEQFSVHYAIVIVFLCIRVALKDMVCVFPVHIAKTDDFLSFKFLEY